MTSIPRRGTMVKVTPVETVWIGSEGSMSPSRKLVARTTASRSWIIPNLGSCCVISPNTGSPGFSSKRTGTFPTFKSRLISVAPVEPRKRECRAQRGMSGKRQFFLHGENADSDAALAFGCRIARQDESRLCKIHLSGQRLHQFVAEAAGIGEDRQRIALEGAVRKDIELHEWESRSSGDLAIYCSVDGGGSFPNFLVGTRFHNRNNSVSARTTWGRKPRRRCRAGLCEIG